MIGQQAKKTFRPSPSTAIAAIVLLLALWGCSGQDVREFGTCISCHKETHPDQAHRLACTSCHEGDSKQKKADKAHWGLIASPAHPDHMAEKCGSCHADEVLGVSGSNHLTLHNLVNRVRQSYGANESLSSLTEIPVNQTPENPLELVDDMLRRRCLVCHLYYEGESYSATVHGTGCAACHMDFENGRPGSHTFLASPSDKQCLSCHYGNYVGADYYGRYEHDLNVEYRTPYYTDKDTRPYGVEYHQLSTDIHLQNGLGCTDCHTGQQLMNTGDETKPSCRSCHDKEMLENTLPDRVQRSNGGFTFLPRSSATPIPLTLMSHPAHQYADRVACQVCHAQWSYNDGSTHLLRSDLDEYDEWDRLTVQGSRELEELLKNNLDYDKEELPPAMVDKISGDLRPGIWYKGYLERRWERMVLGQDEDGRLVVLRPVLDYTLSWIDEDEVVQFDSLKTPAANKGMRPYTPHTTGPAGMFYMQRLRPFLDSTESPDTGTN